MKNTISILIVDDEKSVIGILVQLLRIKGYIIKTAGSADEALECLEKEKIDLVISDIVMPETDGYELLKIIKKKYPHIFVILMTGYANAHSVKKAISLGADEYITKPFQNYEITMIIERICWRILSGQAKSKLPSS